MGRPKQLLGSVMSIDLPPVETPEVKKKREVSDKQRENLAKGMAALKAKREAKNKVKKVEDETPETPEPVAPVAVAPIAPVAVVASVEPVVKKERKPRVVKNYLSAEEFNSFKSELFNTLKKPELEVSTKPIRPEYSAPIVVQPTTILKERLITGSELLDRIFKF